MDIDIKSGNKKVVASGLFISDCEKSEISFKIGKKKANFTFIFKNDKNQKNPRIKWEPADNGKRLILNFINFNDDLGDSTDEPLHLANYTKKKKLYLKVQIKSISNKTKKVSYTFYLEDKND